MSANGFSQFKDWSVYVVSANARNLRARSLLQLEDRFASMKFLTCKGEKMSVNHHLVKVGRSVTGILRMPAFKKIRKWLDKYLYFPSRKILCARALTAHLIDLVATDPVTSGHICLILCLPPHDLLVVGQKLKRRFPAIKLVVDWQDLWSYDESYHGKIPAVYREKARKLEQDILLSCDMNVTTNPRAARVLVEHYQVPPDLVRAVVHPFAQEEAAQLASVTVNNRASRNSEAVKIGFLGFLSKPPKVPGPAVLGVIDELIRSGCNLEFHIYGDTTELTRASLQRLASPKIFLHGRAEHEQSLRNIAACDLLLIVLADLPNCKAIMHAKLPYYLILNRPIVALVPDDSFVADVVRMTGSGVVIGRQADWQAGIGQIVEQYAKGELRLERNEAAVAEYSWDKVSECWLRVLSEVCVTPATVKDLVKDQDA